MDKQIKSLITHFKKYSVSDDTLNSNINGVKVELQNITQDENNFIIVDYYYNNYQTERILFLWDDIKGKWGAY